MLELDIEGTIFEFEIEDYKPSTRECWDTEWCTVTARATSDVLNYSIRTACMLCCEVEYLYKRLMELENGALTEDLEICNIEPDFEYILYPGKNSDYFMDWKFNLWNGDMISCNSFTIMFDVDEIQKLRIYMGEIIEKADHD